MKVRPVPIVIAVSVTLCLAVVFWKGTDLYLYASEDHDYPRYSLKYWLATPPKDLREAPAFLPASQRVFQYHRAMDCGEVNQFLLRYCSTESASEVRRQMEVYLKTRGWREDPDMSSLMGWPVYSRGRGGRFQVRVNELTHGSEVTLVMKKP